LITRAGYRQNQRGKGYYNTVGEIDRHVTLVRPAQPYMLHGFDAPPQPRRPSERPQRRVGGHRERISVEAIHATLPRQETTEVICSQRRCWSFATARDVGATANICVRLWTMSAAGGPMSSNA
jgi:hypothetical protein